MSNLFYPFRIDGNGRVAVAESDEHVRQMIEQLLFTAPGERVNRPDFGSGLIQLVFAPNSQELAAATEFMIQSAIQQYLGDLVKPESVQVESRDSTLTVVVQYVVQRSQQRAIARFTREV